MQAVSQMIANKPTKIDRHLVKKASITCSEAFKDDPLTVYLIPDQTRRNNLCYGFEYYLRMAIVSGAESYTSSHNCEGIAVWQDSLKKEPFGLVFRGGNPFLPFRCGIRYIMSGLDANRLSIKIRRKYAPKHHLYLSLLAVHPDHQGMGYSSQLLKPMFSKLDSVNLPCFLDTQNPKNVSLYQRFGFNIVHETKFDNVVPFYAMLRY